MNIFIGQKRYNIKQLSDLFKELVKKSPKGSKLIFFAPLGVGVNEENQ